MTEEEILAKLKPCPFCGAGETIVDKKYLWQGGCRPSALISVAIGHWCPKPPGCVGIYLQFRGRDEESAIKAWNRRPEGT